MVLGLGAGWHAQEYHAYGWPFPAARVRIDQLAEAIELIRTLWTSAPATYQGRYYQVANAYCAPQPDPIVSIRYFSGEAALSCWKVMPDDGATSTKTGFEVTACDAAPAAGREASAARTCSSSLLESADLCFIQCLPVLLSGAGPVLACRLSEPDDLGRPAEHHSTGTLACRYAYVNLPHRRLEHFRSINQTEA